MHSHERLLVYFIIFLLILFNYFCLFQGGKFRYVYAWDVYGRKTDGISVKPMHRNFIIKEKITGLSIK